MKFRGIISETCPLTEFMSIATCVSKLSKICVFRITNSKVYFISSDDDGGTSHPYIWCELPVNFYFREFTFSGASEEHNEIYLEISSDHFAKSLATLKQDGKCLKIKLVNKNTACLSFIVQQGAEPGLMSRECVHDIPVDVISRKHWDDYQEPQFVDFHVTIQLPNLKSIRKIVERMKNVNHSLTVMANKSGRLTLRVKSNIVTISAHFTDLTIESFDVGSTQIELDETHEECISATIDARKFLHFLTGMHISNANATMSIVQSQMVKLYIERQGAVSLQCFLMEFDA